MVDWSLGQNKQLNEEEILNINYPDSQPSQEHTFIKPSDYDELMVD